jgi:hypothetical protein
MMPPSPTRFFSPRTPRIAGLLAGAVFLSLGLCRGWAAEEPVITAVSAKVSDDYVRTKLPNGKFEPESYTFGEGGVWGGAMPDASADKLRFLNVARTIAGPLAEQGYLPGREANDIKFLIMVYWGTTTPPKPTGDSVAYQNAASAMSTLEQAKMATTGGSGIKKFGGSNPGPPDEENAATAAMAALQAQNAMNRRTDVQNARMLGYDSWWDATAGLEGTPLDIRRQDMLEELEEARYFVILMAYDFQLLRKEKKHKLVWETRFSIRQRGNDFDQQLAAMAQYASRYFGQDTHGLVRKPLPETHVDLGEIKFLGEVPEKK